MEYKSALIRFLDISWLRPAPLTSPHPPEKRGFLPITFWHTLLSLSAVPFAFKTFFFLNAAIWESFVIIAMCLEEANCVGCSLQRHFRVVELVISRLTLKMGGEGMDGHEAGS